MELMLLLQNKPSNGQDAFEVIATQEDLLDYPAYHYNDSIFGLAHPGILCRVYIINYI